MRTLLSHHLLLHGPGKVFKENLIHDFPRDQNEADWLVVKYQETQTLPFFSSRELKKKKKSMEIKQMHKYTSCILKNSMKGSHFIALGY